MQNNPHLPNFAFFAPLREIRVHVAFQEKTMDAFTLAFFRSIPTPENRILLTAHC